MSTRIIRGTPHLGFVGKSRLAPMVCSLLVLWSGIDSQFFMLITDGTLPASIPSPLSFPDDSDDDEMIVPTSTTVSLQVIRKKDHHPLPQDLRRGNLSDLSSCQLSRLPAWSDCAGRLDFSEECETPLRC
jgi:hypothetical protein